MNRLAFTTFLLLQMAMSVVRAEAVRLRCEALETPAVIDVATPRLSWQMTADHRQAAQSAYQILCATRSDLLAEGKADLWDSAKVESNQSTGIRYKGKPVPRGVPCHWMVRIWDEKGEASPWSKPATWRFANFSTDADWQAPWISGPAPAPFLRGTLDLAEAPKSAMIYCNAIGFFQLFVNGQRIGDDEFSPHVSELGRRTLYLAYDIAPYLKKGTNAICFRMGRGWSTADNVKQNRPTVIPAWEGLESPAIRARLEIVEADGKEVVMTTGPDWRTLSGEITHRGRFQWNDFGGETHDATIEVPDWMSPEFDAGKWAAAKVVELAEAPSSAQMLPPSRVVETLSPVEVKPLDGEKGSWLVDMGKAMTGTFEITFPPGPRGHRVLMEFGDWHPATGDKPINQSRVNILDEVIDKDGAPIGSLTHFNQISEYVFRGSGQETFTNRFNYASGRHLIIRNAPPGEIKPEDIKGRFITTDLPTASTFSCSNETLNGIHRMMEHTLRCLMLGGYQVDCNSRERMGYGGDGQASLDTTLNLFDADAFYRKWTQDWIDGQGVDGGISYVTPARTHGGGPFWPGFLIAATWKHYLHYGDIELLRRNYPAIKKWLGLAESKTKDGLQERFSGPPNSKALIFYLGDWASPGGINDQANSNLFIQSYLPYAITQGAAIAEALGLADDAKELRERAAKRQVATHKALFDPEGKKYGSEDQVNYILPLAGGVVPEELRAKVLTGFEKTLLEKNKGHLSTGLAGTYMMVQYLQSIGRDDLIYEFASKKTYPSWGYMLENGATATWESWDGKRLNWTRVHNCYNSIGSWFIEGLGGIRPDPSAPGYKSFLIKPAIVGDLTWVKASHDSQYGTIRSGWKRDGENLAIDVTVPPNTSAKVFVPAKDSSSVTESGKPAAEAEGVKFLRMENNAAVYAVGSGSYQFQSQF
jgi:alpha-L-rhamnosidase